jgi:hypothetical protein
MAGKPDIIATTKELFGKLYGSPVSDDDAQEIINNVFDYFQLLDRWEQEAIAAEASKKQPA